jgi:glycosyltransferase involved in cell wall biosynthesis
MRKKAVMERKKQINKKLPTLTIFFPFWNEEDNIEHVVRAAIPVANQYAEKWEILMIDDGSSDKTMEIAQRLAKEYKNLRAIGHTPNRGYGAALNEGFTYARYDYIIFTDGDGQFDFSEIAKFINNIQSYDMVIGYRKKRRDKNLFKRLLLMYLLKIWDLILFRFYFKDIDCAFKMFKKDALEKIMPFRSEGALISTEILAKAKKKGLKIKEVGVTHYPREQGHQTGANLPVITRAVLESLILWYDLHYGRT